MARKILRIYVEKIVVKSNGIPPGWDDNSPHNLIVATLLYPRSGAPTVGSTKQVKLQNGIPFTPIANPPETVWLSLIFKEEVDGETELQVKVFYHHDPSKVEMFLKKLFGFATTILESVVAATGVLGIVISGVVGEISDEVKQSGPEGLVLGQTQPLQVSVGDTFPSPVALGITNPTSKEISYFPPGSTTPASFTIPADNGEITLRLEWESL